MLLFNIQKVLVVFLIILKFILEINTKHCLTLYYIPLLNLILAGNLDVSSTVYNSVISTILFLNVFVVF